MADSSRYLLKTNRMGKLEQYLANQTYSASDVDHPLLREVAYERLKDALKHADLQPGDPLSETRISETLGISRTPVREAIQQLAKEGLVQIVPGRAVTIPSPSMQDVFSVVHVRSLLEPEMVRLVSESASRRDLTALWEALEAMEQAVEDDDRAAWSRADTKFHDLLSELCPNKLLGQLVLEMRNRMHHLTIDSQTSASRFRECTREHRDVVDAIASHKPENAERTMQHHLEQLRDSMFRRLVHN